MVFTERTCLICGVKRKNHFPKHLRSVHNLTIEDYYRLHVDSSPRPTCQLEGCTSLTPFKDLDTGWRPYCSNLHGQQGTMSRTATRLWSEPEGREFYTKCNIENVVKQMQDPFYSEKMAEKGRISCIKQWAKPEYREKQRVLHSTISRARVLKQWQDPAYVELMSNMMRKQWESRDFRRKVRNYCCGYYWSVKTKRPVYYRSSYELKAYKLLDQDPSVASFLEEPFPIEMTEGRYWPDLLVNYIDGSKALIEIKPFSLLVDPLNIQKLWLGYQYAIANDMKFLIYTESELNLC